MVTGEGEAEGPLAFPKGRGQLFWSGSTWAGLSTSPGLICEMGMKSPLRDVAGLSLNELTLGAAVITTSARELHAATFW